MVLLPSKVDLKTDNKAMILIAKTDRLYCQVVKYAYIEAYLTT